MVRSTEWHKYIDNKGNFEFPKYLYKMISDLMKTNLDLGTLVCNDPSKLRAYKERVKTAYKQKWLDLASVLEFFELIQPCICQENEFCKVCGGSRFILSETVTADEIRQISYAFDKDIVDAGIAEKLEKGLKRAIELSQGKKDEKAEA